jgi:hypothetical protein
LQQLTTFAAIIDILKEQITWHLSSSFTGPPLILPDDVTGFCADALMVNTVTITQNWTALRDILWVSSQDGASGGDMEMGTPLRNGERLELFLKHGLKHSIGAFCYSSAPCCINSSSVGVGLHTILPPTRNCLDSRCTISIRGISLPQELSKLETYSATLFTTDFGPIPVWSTSASCRSVCLNTWFLSY